MIAECHNDPQYVHHKQESGQQNQTEARPEFVVIVVGGRTLYTQVRTDEAERCE